MSRTEFLIPKPGLVVRDPETLQVLPEEGDTVVLTSYWRRRISDGDVTIRAPAKTKPVQPAANGGAKE